MVKDKNSIPAVVWKRRIAKILSWWARGRSNLATFIDVFLVASVGTIWIKEVLGYIPNWFMILVYVVIPMAILYFGYWDSESGFRQFQNDYEGEVMSPPIKKINLKLDTIIKNQKDAGGL